MLNSLYDFIYLIDVLFQEIIDIFSNSSVLYVLTEALQNTLNALFRLFNSDNAFNVDLMETMPALLAFIVMLIAFKFVIKTIKRVINAITMQPEKKRRY